MLSVPDEVRCAVCKNIFCCLDCRTRHEQNAHNENDVKSERVRMVCALCNGSQTMEFRNRNDFALIMHLCQAHLPLHCKKCLTQFNTIGDFNMENKCIHINAICDLHPSPNRPVETNSVEKACDSETTTTTIENVNYITANCFMQKSSVEGSISDSILSLKNYSAILHSSNNALYKTQSPNSLAETLAVQTSTPMHQNLLVGKSPDLTNGCCGSGSISNISSSSESDGSPQQVATDLNETRKDLQSIVVTQKKTTFKRSKQLLTMTPLTRQLMTKSIHRAILEYQHSHVGPVLSPRSPLDLRTSIVIRRDGPHASPSIEISPKSNSKLETVYEQTKDECDNDKNEFDENKNVTIDENEPNMEAIKETPVPISRKLSNELSSSSDNEVWYTPKEFLQTRIIEKPNENENYTPKKKPLNESINIVNKENEDPIDSPSKEEPKKTTSKLWSFVTTIFRLASLTPATESDEKSKEISPDSIASIKRCASMTDVLGCSESSENTDNKIGLKNRSNPIKRRRITSLMNSPLDENTNPYRRIKCRRSIHSMDSTT